MKLTTLTRELSEQVRLLRSAIYSINKDTTGKEHALGIDKHCARLTELSSCLQNELELNNRKCDLNSALNIKRNNNNFFP